MNRGSKATRRTMRVLHVITRMIVGGAQENTLLTVQGLDRMPEYEVTLVSGIERGPEGSLLEQARQTVDLALIPELARSVNPATDLRALTKLYRFIRRGRYHVVHTHSSKAGVLGRLAAKLAGTPIIVHTLHSLVFHDYQPRVVNRTWWAIKKACAPLTDHYISVADAISEKAIAEGIAPPERFSTVYSGMELEWFLSFNGDRASIRRELGIPDQAPVVGKVARLFPLKGHEQLLDAAPRIAAAHPDVRFLLVGDGSLHEQVRARARAAGLEDRFVFAGLIPRERMPAMLAAMDLLVHTSLREGIARALPQALAMGLPCVSVDLDGAREVVVQGRTGYMVPPRDPVALADAVARLLSDEPLRARMGKSGRELVDPAFRAATMVDRIAALYQRLAEEKALALDRFDRGHARR
ncbi:MAG TPA: glycosyltransferase family 4 protein [Solirubrobacterales bacterium]|nr:glycosyltransferase family 4 protein [Solirubrobacterales bacterium]